MNSAAAPGLAIIAGAGGLPREIADVARASGRAVTIVVLRGIADAAQYADFPHLILGIGQLGSLLDALATRNLEEVLLVGSLPRPDITGLMPDMGLVRHLPDLAKAMRGGDDQLLRGVIAILEKRGLRVVGPADVAPELAASDMQMSGRKPDKQSWDDASRGLALLQAMSPFDVGQAAVIIGGRVVAVEAAEGTDAMLMRVADMKASGRLRTGKAVRRGILVKIAKIGQDLRVDMPTIGPDTVANAAAAGLSGLVLGIGEVLVVNKAKTVALAKQHELFITGIANG
jgi:UDP-2,3-diacylglucosamine hydrolase